MNNDENLERILQLAESAKRSESGGLWKSDQDAAIEAHGEACDNLWAELYRQLDERSSGCDPVHPPKMPPDPRRELKKQIVAALKEEIPGMVASIIDQF